MLKWVEKLWYGHSGWSRLLLPFAWVYQGVVACRRALLTRFWHQRFPVPVIVVGNLTQGGVGKTPLVIALVQRFQARGLRVGVVSRGYGAQLNAFPHAVLVGDLPHKVGDEPLLIAQKTHAPVVIARNRVSAVRHLITHYDSQVIISDDGLQHYRMGRAIEIVVIDGLRGLGNQRCLPAGPLRESALRLNEVDYLVVNGGAWPGAYRMDFIPGALTSLLSGMPVDVHTLTMPVAAVTGTGHPQRFFQTLTALNVSYQPYVFPDHYPFTVSDFKQIEPCVVMTEKDAVKCAVFAASSMYFLPIEAKIDQKFWDALWTHPAIKALA